MSNKNEIQYFNVLKTIAVIAVCVLHTFYATLGFSDITTSQKILSLSFRNSMMWTVPIFVMVSGALLLNQHKQVSYKKLFFQYILRMIVALVLFSTLFVLFDTFIIGKYSAHKIISQIIKDIFLGTGWNHMWYIYMMIGFYLMLPIYKKVLSNCQKNDVLYIIIILALFQSIVPLINKFTNIEVPFYLFVNTIYPLYLFLGYALHNKYLHFNIVQSILLIVIPAIIIVLCTYFGVTTENEIVKSLPESYNFIVIVLEAVGIFSLVENLKEMKNQFIYKIFKETSYCSFGIYLLHMALLKVIMVKLQFNPYAHGGIVTIFGIAIAVFILSFAMTFILKKVPYLKKII